MWPPEDAEAFWGWSCGRWARPGVAEACLRPQDGHGLRVDLLLLACWLAEHGRAPTADQASRIVAVASAWQAEVVMPLRLVRRRLKRLAAEAPPPRRPAIEALRRAVADDELAAERIEQAELQRLAAACPADHRGTLELARANAAMLSPLPGNNPAALAVLSLILEPAAAGTARDCRSG